MWLPLLGRADRENHPWYAGNPVNRIQQALFRLFTQPLDTSVKLLPSQAVGDQYRCGVRRSFYPCLSYLLDPDSFTSDRRLVFQACKVVGFSQPL